jgi:hypothetical protein
MARKKKAKGKNKAPDLIAIFEYSTNPEDHVAVAEAYRLIFDAYHFGDKKKKRSDPD